MERHDRGWENHSRVPAFSLGFLEELRDACHDLTEEERVKMARDILETRIEDLEKELEALGLKAEDSKQKTIRAFQIIAQSLEEHQGHLASLEEMEKEFKEKLREMPTMITTSIKGMEDEKSRDFEKRYLDYLKRTYGRLRVLGVREMRDLNQALSIAYVSLRVKTRDESKESLSIQPAEGILAKHPLLTIRGAAGSGKTTLLHWFMVKCSSEKKEGDSFWRRTSDYFWGAPEEPFWKIDLIPFFIPLRRLDAKDKGQPDIKEFVNYSVDPKVFGESPPENWINDILKRQQRGAVLIDGVDELPAKHRPEFWEWLRNFMEEHPGNRILITSRFFPEPDKEKADKLWDPPKDFHSAELDDMNDSDIQQFIQNWHDAVLENEDDPVERAELERRRDELPGKLESSDNRRVRDLCRTPLLCSLVCALNWREEGYLPKKRVELYESCCKMLIDERDRKRDIRPPDPPLKYLTREDKEMILQRLALDMMRNKAGEREGDYAIEVERKEAQFIGFEGISRL